MEAKFKTATIEFTVNNYKHTFEIYHNLPNIPGLSLEDALDNWLVRTTKYSCGNFCNYVNSKNTGYTAINCKKLKKK